METGLRLFFSAKSRWGSFLHKSFNGQNSLGENFRFSIKYFKQLFILLAFLLFAFWGNAQTVIASGSTVAASAITAGNTITINAGGTLNMDVSRTFTSITTAGTGTSNISGANTVTLSGGSITINSTNNNPHTLAISAASTVICTAIIRGGGGNSSSVMNITVSGILRISGTVFSAAVGTNNLNCNAGSTVEYNGAGQTVYIATSGYSNLTLSGSGVKALNSALVNAVLSLQGAATTSGIVGYGSSSTLEYKGSVPQTTGIEFISPFPGSGGVIINNNNGTGVTLGSARSVGIRPFTIGSTVSGSMFNDGGFQLTSTGTLTFTSGTFNIGLGGNATAYPNFGTNSILAGTTVNYNSTSSQIISSGGAGINYANLTNANGPRTLGTSGIIGISGTFTPGSGTYTVGTSTVSFNGIAAQVIPAITFSFYNLIISNAAGISSIGGNTTVTSSLALTNGVVTTGGTNRIIIPNGASISKTNGWVNGNLQQYIASGASSIFHVGNATVYRPAVINFAAGSVAGDLRVVQSAGFHPQIAASGLDNTTPKAITPFWNLLPSGGLSGTYDATFNFVAGDVPGAAVTNNFVIRRFNTSWTTTIDGIRTATSTQATGLTEFGDFAIGETLASPSVSTQPSNVAVCLGSNASFTSASTSTPTPTVFWQRSQDGGFNWDNIISTTDGGKYTNFTTNTLNITAPDISMNGYQYRSVYTNINNTASPANSNAATLTVTDPPTITLLDYATSPFANITATPQTVTLTGTNAFTGGTFTSDPGLTINSTTGAITPNTSTLGNHTVTYTIAAAGGCGQVTATTIINITAAPTANFVYDASSFCVSNNTTYLPTLTGTGNFNNGGAGFYSVSPASSLLVDAATGAIVPNNATAGTYTITYHIPATTSPAFPASTSDVQIIITAIPTATISYPAGPFCTSDQAAKTVTLNGTGAFSNGVFSATPLGLSLDATTGEFTPNLSTVNNNYIITYTIPASGGCAAFPVTATPFDIVAVPTASISYNGGNPYCQAIITPQPVTLIGASGGSFSFTPAGLTIDAAGAITPGTSIAGDYDVTYTIPATGPCGVVEITTTVTISETPTGNISYPLQPYCTSDPAKAVSFIAPTGPYAGGTFSSTAGLSINATTGTITPATSTPNSYTVTYSTPFGCPTTFTTPVQIDGSPAATISYANGPFCITDGTSRPVTLTGTGTFNGGTFSSTAGLSIDGVNGDITPSTSTAGTYVVTYTIIPASPNCAAISTTTSITITPAVGVPTAITISSGAQPTCQLTNGTTTTTYASTATNSTGLNWSISTPAAGSISSAGVMTWANGFFGSVDIQVTANGCNGLSAQVIRTVNITASVGTPTAISIDAGTEPTCQTIASTTTTYGTTASNNTGLNWSVTNAAAGSISSSGVMTWTVGFAGSVNIQVTASGCNGPSTQVVRTVNITATVGTPTAITVSSGTQPTCQITASTPTTTYATTATNNTGLNWSVSNALAGSINSSGVMTWSVGFSGSVNIQVTASGCNGPSTQVVRQVSIAAAVATPAFALGASSTRCQGSATVNYTASAANSTGITYTLDGASITGGNTIVAGTGAVTFAAGWSGTTTITASAAGCNGPAATTHVVTIDPAAIGGTLSLTLKTECVGANNATITLTAGTFTGTVNRWEQSIDFGTTWTTALVTNSTSYTYTNLSQTTYFRAVLQSGVCVTTANSAIAQVIVNPAFNATISASLSTTTCLNQPVTLTASGYTSSGLVFTGGTLDNNSPQGWAGMSGNASNNSSGPNSNNPWGITNGGIYNLVQYNSTPANDKFFMVNGTTTDTLETPIFSTIGMASALLAYNQGYNLNGAANAKVEISIDGGVTYTTLQTFTGNSASTSPLGATTFIGLNNYLGRTNLRIRFNYTGSANCNWAIDNVYITNTSSNPLGVGAFQALTYAWSPATDLSATSGKVVTFTPTTPNGTGVKSITLTTTAGGCAATTTFVDITVNPLPIIAAKTSATCSGSGFTLSPIAGAGELIPTGTTYSWGAPSVTGGLTGGAAGANLTSISGTLNNPNITAETATYSVTPRSGALCNGGTFTVTVTVNPSANISPISREICSGETITVTPLNITDGRVPAGTTYSWSSPTVTGGITGGVAGSGLSNISGTLVNTSTTPQTATYTVTALTGTCTGNTFLVTVIVNPTTFAGTLPSVSVCNSGSGTLVLAGNVGSVVQWESSIDDGITWVVLPANPSTSQAYTATAQTTLYRALVKSGTCTQAYSNIATVGLHNVWTGKSGTNWSTASNWSDGLLPNNSCPDVIIPNVPNKPLLSAGTFAINNLIIQTGATLTVTGATLQVAGSISSDPGSFNVSNGSLEINGTITQGISGSNFWNRTVKDLTVSNTSATGLQVSSTPNDTLNITGTLSFGNASADLNTGNNITLKSTLIATANVGVLASGNSISGDVIVERYLRNESKWRLLSAPTNKASQTVRNSWQENGVYIPGFGVNTADTRTNAIALGFDYRGNNTSVKRWNDVSQTFDAVANTNDLPIGSEEGYIIFVSGDRSITFPGTNATTLRTKGSLNTGNYKQINISAGKFGIVGNPYASRINLKNINFSGIDQAVYVWDPSLGGVYGLGGFNTFLKDENGDYINFLPSAIYGTDQVNNFIESGAAFFVRGGAGGGTVNFTEAAKTTGSAVSSFTSGAPQGLRLNLNLAATTPILLDATMANFADNYANSVDENDIWKLGTIGESVSWKTDNKDIVIDRRATVSDLDTLHISIGKMRVQNYQWEVVMNNMDFPGRQAFLLDRYLQTSTALNMEGTSKISFKVQNIAGSYAADRFKIVFKQQVVLPVTITSIAANRNSDKTVTVAWKVQSELNLTNYEVQRSTDGRDFASILTQLPEHNNGGSVNYQALDRGVAAGDIFYRIKANSVSGQVQYSAMAKVAAVKTNASVSVYPNPVTGKLLNVRFSGMEMGTYTLSLVSAAGQTVYTGSVAINTSSTTESIQLHTATAGGRYQLIVTSPSGIQTNQQVFLQ